MKKLSLSFCIFILSQFCNAQVLNQLIIKTKNATNRNTIELQLPNGIDQKSITALCPKLQLYLIETSSNLNEEDLNQIKSSNNLVGAWFDEVVFNRAEPNDTNYKDQWAIRLSNIDEVWDFTTGGTTVNGKEIVIAVMDDGFDVAHQDLQGIFWNNPSEVPFNNQDDDGNGYIDDYQGLNINNEGDIHPPLNHGTSVVGIIGANSNNAEGVTGVNWNIKILPISGVDRVSEIIESYNYIYELRKKYNDSQGSEGAFIVVSSYSGGVPDRFGTEGIYKEWCDLYDLMGNEGILSFGATDNRYVDVDEVGDMPSTCTSDFFIGVTSLSRGGIVDQASAYGIISIDIAAPGDKIITTKRDGDYGDFEGTSAATPMVSGTAALLYSTPCQKFDELTENDPTQAARIIRKVLLEGVSKSDEMTNLYTSGGYLDAFRSLKQMNEICEGELLIESERGALRIIDIVNEGRSLRISYISANENVHFLRLVDPLGRIIVSKDITPQSYGEKVAIIEFPQNTSGPIYLSLGNKKHTVSKAYFVRGL